MIAEVNVEFQHIVNLGKFYDYTRQTVGHTRKIECVEEEIRTERINASKQKRVSDFFV